VDFKGVRVQILLVLISLVLCFIVFTVSEARSKTEEINEKISIDGCSTRTTEDIVYTSISLRREGYDIPSHISCNSEVNKKIFSGKGSKYDFKDISGFFYPSLDLIYINDNSPNDSVPYTFTHEVGHYNHYLKIGLDQWIKLSNKRTPNNLEYKIGQELGFHASETEEEFVAEYFALTHMGVTFPKDLQEHYEELNGI
jgi:hypothetical protein